MNIGIITVYDSPNYGAFLQGYAMKTVLESMGHNPYFIKFRDDSAIKNICLGKKNTLSELKSYIMHYKSNMDKYNCAIYDSNQLPFIHINDIGISNLDAVLLGSDEIWNSHVSTFKNRLFYGDGIAVERKYAYAPSVGSVTEDDIKKFNNNYLALRNVNIIGVRDKRTQDIIKKSIDINAPIVCDPTCLVTKDIFEGVGNMPVQLPSYLLVYSYGVSKNMQSILKKYAKEHNLLLVSLCMKHSWCKKHLNTSALNFYHIIKNADCVYTSTFHGTIFTFMNHKRCIISANSLKLIDFINRFNMSDMTVRSEKYDNALSQLSNIKDYSKYDDKIMEYRVNSLRLLENALCIVK